MKCRGQMGHSKETNTTLECSPATAQVQVLNGKGVVGF